MASLLAACVSALLVAFGPPAGDAPAHLYRTSLVREGVIVWDNLWYGGHYPLASYSLLYHLPAALVGNLPLVVAAAVASASLFARVAIMEWGWAAVWPSRVFAVVACAPLFTGTYAWAVGTAFALGTLLALQAGRRWLALGSAGLALGCSPLAFVLLCLVLLALLVVRRPAVRETLALGAGLTVLALAQVTIAVLFPAAERHGFRTSELALALTAASLGALVAARAPEGRVLVALFLLWGLVCLLAFAIPSPVGSTIARFRVFVFPLGLLAAQLAGFRPRLLVVPAVVAAFAYTVSPWAYVATGLTDTRPAEAAFWRPALDFLRANNRSDERVDVVPTFDNWEAYYLPSEGFALARGWYRQLDLARNPVLYERDLTAGEYETWLRSLGVRYVLLPHAPLDRLGAEGQARLLRSGRSGLVEVFRSKEWTIYELPGATPVLTGPGPARVTLLGHDRIEGYAELPGSYVLRVRSTPYLVVEEGDVCLGKAAGGMTRLEVRRAGRFVLAVPGAGELLRIALGARPAC